MTDTVTALHPLPDRRYGRELLRPWKLVTFSAGLIWLIYGGLCYDICDWDVGISLIMGGLTYVCAPWSAVTIYTAIRHRPRGWPIRIAAALLPAMFTVDWVYWLYHTMVGNRMLRWENFKVSMALYFICGILWCYPGSLKELNTDIRETIRRN